LSSSTYSFEVLYISPGFTYINRVKAVPTFFPIVAFFDPLGASSTGGNACAHLAGSEINNTRCPGQSQRVRAPDLLYSLKGQALAQSRILPRSQKILA